MDTAVAPTKKRKRTRNRFLVRREYDSLRPIDTHGLQHLARIGAGEIVACEIIFIRNPTFNALYWSLLTLVWGNLPEPVYPTVDDFHNTVKVMLGIRTRVFLPEGFEFVTEDGEIVTVGPGGGMVFMPGSIAFHNMDETEFSAYFDRVCDLVVAHFLPGVTDATLRGEVESMTGIAPPKKGNRLWVPRQRPRSR